MQPRPFHVWPFPMTTDVSELSLSDARAIAFASFPALEAVTVELHKADRRVLAEDASALNDLPTADNSAMDGWAVSGLGPWRIVGQALAGAPLVPDLAQGTCVRVGTGSVLPKGTTAVLRWEDATESGDSISAQGELAMGKDIRPAGMECKTGDLLLSRGDLLTPAAIGLLAAAGHDEVLVRRTPRAALLILGDELLLRGVPQRGQVRDSLGPQLPALISRLGAHVTSTTYVPDRLPDVTSALQHALEDSDVIVTSGSTADGAHDFLHDALEILSAELLVNRVKVRPGHPMLLARIAGKPLIGLPGNPQSAVVGLMTLGWPVFQSLLGQKLHEPSRVTLTEEVTTPTNFARLIIGRNDSSTFVSVPWSGSNMLRGLAVSQGFAVVPAGGVRAGTTVEWLPLP